MSRQLIFASTLLLAGVCTAGPALAQGSGERVNQLIVYGDDPCPQSSGDEITVCARKDEAERYRIPEPLRDTASPQNDAWANRVTAYETVGREGILSCPPVGAGGATGCTQKLIQQASAERENDPSVRFGELIAAERERRLSTIDAEAAATQARVEEIERQHAERQRQAGQDTPAGN